MNDPIARIDALDLTLFDSIPSQTSDGDRRSLLAVQRAIARARGTYDYLEIGSHLGGSIQPHLADDRCTAIYSIDPRPAQQPDDRTPGFVATYENNSSQRMLDNLTRIGSGDVGKIVCVDRDASQIDPSTITRRPDLVFIDGEHTQSAALSDFRFSEGVVRANGAILFHDFAIVFPAVRAICRDLARQRRAHLALMLEDQVFGIFFDPTIVSSDSYLAALARKNWYFLVRFGVRRWWRRHRPFGRTRRRAAVPAPIEPG